jgi:hypothetical protein
MCEMGQNFRREKAVFSLQNNNNNESELIACFLACVFTKIRYYSHHVAGIAQLVEQLTCNQ